MVRVREYLYFLEPLRLSTDKDISSLLSSGEVAVSGQDSPSELEDSQGADPRGKTRCRSPAKGNKLGNTNSNTIWTRKSHLTYQGKEQVDCK